MAHAVPGQIEDPRTPLEKVRRADLWLILRAYKIPCSPDMPATSMRTLLNDAGVNVMKVDFARIKAERKAELKQIWPETPVAPIPEVQPVKVKSNKLAEFHALKRQCKELGIDVVKGDNLVVLKEKLAEHGKDTTERSE